MKNINLLFIDDNQNLIKKAEEYFQEKKTISVRHKASNGKDALNIIIEKQNEYDFIVMELLIPEIDGLELLENMKKANIKKPLIVLTSYKKDYTVKMTNEYGVDYYMLKPCSMNSLEKRILEIANVTESVPESVDNKKTIEMSISKLLHSLGVPSHVKGYQYIRESIYMMYAQKEMIRGITKEVYPAIAERFKTTSTCVERAIRNAIEIGWTRGNLNLMEEFFGYSVDYDKTKPTNSEFIATLADRLKFDDRLLTI